MNEIDQAKVNDDRALSILFQAAHLIAAKGFNIAKDSPDFEAAMQRVRNDEIHLELRISFKDTAVIGALVDEYGELAGHLFEIRGELPSGSTATLN